MTENSGSDASPRPITRRGFLKLTPPVIAALLAACKAGPQPTPDAVDTQTAKNDNLRQLLANGQNIEFISAVVNELPDPDYRSEVNKPDIQEKLKQGFWWKKTADEIPTVPLDTSPEQKQQRNEAISAYFRDNIIPQMVVSEFSPLVETGAILYSRMKTPEDAKDDGDIVFSTMSFSETFEDKITQTAYALFDVVKDDLGHWYFKLLINADKFDKSKPSSRMEMTNMDWATILVHEVLGHWQLTQHLYTRYEEVMKTEVISEEIYKNSRLFQTTEESYAFWMEGATVAAINSLSGKHVVTWAEIGDEWLKMKSMVLTDEQKQQGTYRDFPRWSWPEWVEVIERMLAPSYSEKLDKKLDEKEVNELAQAQNVDYLKLNPWEYYGTGKAT